MLLPGTGTAFGSAPERITFFPSGETVSTFPVTDLNCATVGGAGDGNYHQPPASKNEKSVPMYAFAPWRSKTSEFGVAGNPTALPTVLFGGSIGIRRLMHPVVVAQLFAGEEETPVLDT